MNDLDAETLNNLNSSIDKLNKAMEKLSATWLQTGKEVKSTSDCQKQMEKQIEKNNEKHQKTLNILQSTRETINNIFSTTTKIGGLIAGGGIAAFFTGLASDAVKLDDSMVSLSYRMGKGTEGVKELKSAVVDMQKDIGSTYENAVGIVSTLASSKYVDNIEAAAKGIDLFSRATGVSNDSVASLSVNLSKSAGLGTDAINSIYSSMVSVQQNVGISDSGMSALVNHINEAAVNMSIFGKSADSIKAMTLKTTALVGELEKVGISAERSTQLIESLTDPDRIEDNILLYSQLGISIEDALSGNAGTMLDSMSSGLQDMAQRIVDMGPIAGSQFAKSMGMTYKEAAKMANGEYEDAVKKLTPEEQTLETLEKMQQNTEGIGKKVNSFMNKLEGKIKKLGPVIIAGAGAVILGISSKLKDLFTNTEKQASVMSEGVGKSIEEKAKKSFGLIGKQAEAVGGTIKNWFDSTGVSGFFNGVDSQLDALTKRVTKTRKIDEFFDASLTNWVDSRKKRIDELNVNAEKYKGILNQIGISYEEQKSANDAINALKEKEVPLTKEKSKLIISLYNEINKADVKREAINKKIEEQTNKHYAKVDEVKEIEKNIAEKNKNILELKKAISEQQERLNSAEEKNSNSKRELETIEKTIIALREKSNIGTKEEIKANQEAIADLTKKKAILSAEVTATERIMQSAKAIKSNNEGNLVTAEKELEAMEGKLKAQERLSGISKFFHGTLINIKKAVEETKFGQDFVETLDTVTGKGQTVKALGKMLGKGAISLSLKGLEGIGKGIGSIVKTMGPMALVASILGGLFEKIKEPFENMVENITNNVLPLMKPIFDIFSVMGEQISKMVVSLLPPILKTISMILKAVHVLTTPIRGILDGVGKVLSHFGLKGIGESLQQAAQMLETITGAGMQDALNQAAEAIESSSGDLSKAAEDISGADEPTTYRAEGGTFTTEKLGSSSASTSKQASSTSSVVTTSSGEKAEKQANDEKRDKKQQQAQDDIKNNTSEILMALKIISANIAAVLDKEANTSEFEANKKTFNAGGEFTGTADGTT